ncbi:MAG: ComF family protein [Candidatus Wolfebacteria bacterium]|nr:ComF family protein [Candidatus Wolfebacteria bacterium]
MNKFFIKLKNLTLEILFPPVCLSCGKYLEQLKNNGSGKIICEKCESAVLANNSLFCARCRARLPENKKICHPDCHYILGAAGNYDNEVIKNLIYRLKYKNIKAAAGILSEIMAKYLKEISSLGNFNVREFILVPIPLHKKRERERGFNQSALLAENLGRVFDIPVCAVLKRTKNNKPQAKITEYEKRFVNISGCFEVGPPDIIIGKNILLIDDVFTSGATMDEAAKVLKKAGAKKILALVAAKA